MKINKIKERLKKERPAKTINISIPEDVISDLKKTAVQLGFSNCEALVRAYIGQGLRSDIERLENVEIANFIENLRQQGVQDEKIAIALSELKQVA